MIKCAIFDADGTLLDSMGMWEFITYEYAEKKGVKAPKGLHHTMNRLSLEQCAALYQQLGVPGSVPEIVDELAECAFNGYCTRVPEKPGAKAFLRLLHENGIAVAVATASQAQGVRAALENLGMAPYVDLLMTCTELGTSKEQPDIFLRCGARFGASPAECVVFEDSPYAMETARKAGFPVVAVEDASSLSERSRIEAAANRVIRDYGELIEELLPAGDSLPQALADSVIKP